MKNIFQRLHIGRGMDILSLRLCLLGLANAPVVFMDLMNRVCQPYLDNFFIVIIDDILTYSMSKEDHEAYLKHVVNNDGIHMDSSKIEAMKNWKVPKTPSEIQTFLGLAEDFVVYYDASNQVLGCVFMQRGKYGTKSVIYTDHKSLQHIFDQKELNMRRRRWIELFNDYECEIRYHSRKANSSVKDKILAAPGEVSKVENATAEMLCGLDQLIEKKEYGEYYKMEKLARLYIDKIVVGHGVLVSIISDRDRRFTSRVLENITESLRGAIRYEYDLSSSSEWTKSPVFWAEIRESRLIRLELVQKITNKVVLIKEKLKAVRDRQKSYVDNRRKLLEFEVEDQVLLKVSPWKGVTKEMPITTAKEKAQRRLEVKARSTLMMGIPNEYLLKFNSIKDAKKLLEAVEKRFGIKADIYTMSMDDLYNNLKVYEPEVKGMSSSNSNTKNMAFFSSTNSSTNGAVNTAQAINTANEVSTANTQVNAAFSTNIDNLNDIEEMDLRWQIAMLTMRARRECKALRNQDNKYKESTRKSVPLETSASTAWVSCDDIAIGELKKKAEKAQKEKDVIQINVDKLENASKSLNKLIECQIVDNCKKGLRYENYNTVLPSYTGNFMPPKPDLSFTVLDEFVNKHVVENYEAKSSEKEPKPKIMKKTVKPSIPNIEFVKPRQQEKTARKTAKQVEQPRQNTHSPRGSEPDWLFDIDVLTRIMNYEPIVADPKSSQDDGFNSLSDDRKKVDEDPSKGNECYDQEKEDNVNNTNNVNTINFTVNVDGTNGVNVVGKLPFDPDMPALEDVGTFNF
nr:hypothetical protein [Tanacetum cinerariifolium]